MGKHAALIKPHVFERGDKVFIVTPVAPFDPAPSEIEEFAFSNAIKQHANNKNLAWYKGQYVEADNANANGALWTESELAFASITPNFMPVTVMHDPRTAVGLIADTVLKLRGKDGVPRSRLDNTLALWAHRFPEVVEEAAANYEAGALMQSMECLPTHYDCTVCERRFPKLPGGAERANWCDHLRAADEQAARRLGGVTFTGTGLIFGSRGATGAYSEAHLSTFEDEVAEFHERAHHDTKRRPQPRTRSKRTMEIEDREYQELLAAKTELAALKERVPGLEETAAKVPDLERKVEETEAAKVAAESERDALKTKADELAEEQRATELASTRLGALGKGFKEKLGDFTRGRLEEQAKLLKDDEWDNRLKELEETAGVKRDEGGTEAPAGGGDGTLTAEETARAGGGGGPAGGSGGGNGGNGGAPTPAARRSVVAGLAKKVGPAA